MDTLRLVMVIEFDSHGKTFTEWFPVESERFFLSGKPLTIGCKVQHRDDLSFSGGDAATTAVGLRFEWSNEASAF